MITIIRKDLKYVEIVCDDESDIKDLPTDCYTGSIALVASTKQVLIYNSKGEWV